MNFLSGLVQLFFQDPYVLMYLCHSFTSEPPYQSPPNFAQTFPSTQGFFTQVYPRQTNPLTLRYPKLQNLNRSLEEKLCVT